MALLATFRSSLYMSAPLAVALQTGEIAEILFLAVIGGYALLPVALSYGAFSPKVFWGFALPPVLAFGAAVINLLGVGPALALILALAATVWVMAMVSMTWRQSLEVWGKTHDTSVEMIRDLEIARDRALAERAAADTAREEARRAGQAKSDFLATMSHEIRTPMNGVLGMAEVLRRAETDPAQLSRLQTLTDSGEYLLSILNDILDMSKIEAGRLELMFEPAELPALLNHVGEFWRPQAESKGLDLKLDLHESLPRFVKLDAVRLRQVLFNLIGNALKFTETGSVTLSARAGPVRSNRCRVSISVVDTGPGIPEELLPSIFDRYAQAGRNGGAGLGLAVCQQLTELMGGRIRAESTPGLGAAFHLDLVLEVSQTGPRAADAGAEAMRPLRVLAIDDQAVNLTVLEQLLAPQGHRVAKAGSALEGLKLAGAQPFDVILMDIHMPRSSGMQALKTLRTGIGPNKATPVVALTADVVSRADGDYRALGFAELVTKPIQAAALFGALRRAAGKPARRPARSA
ncbi:ATP-binding protein [Phenylobacterium sp. J367]|uniref:ATP-binding protein n=1 Tax=Phenylobacterium sp. J367 TaxID=2898435 RepID=UPI002151F91F|nr:ATP-binding protein [Phenylobacterium sp. J367]MCR5880306.1 ATP-binding protein [Phenylobacterium sp. J367]